jgi:hypothetical protein
MQGRILLLLAGVMLCWLGLSISSPASAPSDMPGLPSAPAGANEDGGPNAPPPPDGNYPLTLAVEVLERGGGHPVHAHLLTMLLVVTVAFFGARVLWLLTTDACRQGAIRSWSIEDRPWLAVGPEAPSFLGVFRL